MAMMTVRISYRDSTPIKVCPDPVCVTHREWVHFEFENRSVTRRLGFRGYDFKRSDTSQEYNPFGGLEPGGHAWPHGGIAWHRLKQTTPIPTGPNPLRVKYSVVIFDSSTGTEVANVDPEIEIERDVTIRHVSPGLLIGGFLSAVGIALLVKEAVRGRLGPGALKRGELP